MKQLKITKSITNRESESIEKYLQEIGKMPMVTAEDEVILARQIKNGSQKALDKLVKANLRFVVSVAKQYQNKGLTLNDIVNEGNVGLIKAAQRFDETRGFKFISYAVWWIRQAIMQALAEQSRLVRLPLNKIGSLTKINRAFADLEQYHEREPSDEEVGDALGMAAKEVQINTSVSRRHLSLDAPFSDIEGAQSLGDVLSNDTEAPDRKMDHDASLSYELNSVFQNFSDREVVIIKLFYGIGVQDSCTVEDIAMSLDLTRERVRQIKDKAMAKLKVSHRKQRLVNFR